MRALATVALSCPVKPSDVISVYSRFAPVYDLTFGQIVGRYHRHVGAVIAQVSAKKVLEVGVGTGLALAHYPSGTHVTGVDLCPAMLERARRAVAKGVAAQVDLQLVDAEALPFADATFDAVTLPFVVSVTPTPERLLSEARRVLKPGGSLVMLNHFGGVQGLGWMERAFAPFASRIGFRTDLTLQRVLQMSGLQVQQVRPLRPLGFFTLVHLTSPLPLKAAA